VRLEDFVADGRPVDTTDKTPTRFAIEHS